MKLLLMSLVFTIGIGQVVACADFAGSYTCSESSDDGGDVYDLLIEQDGKVFTVTEDDEEAEIIIADGKWRDRADDYDIVDSSYSAICQEQSVIYNMKGNYLEDDQKSPFELSTIHTLLPTGGFEAITKITSAEIMLNESTTCIKEVIED